ncbi:hypothetical protein DAI22_07g038700 [Oryza sativa Japonica Group]|nr:hypothetical protein DAI22_07g038700 [Oryza sativa Japonica Group]KAF2921506.1 hypothetical protein DAI22_07g038700 [Oryza sativa Japonica Group]
MSSSFSLSLYLDRTLGPRGVALPEQASQHGRVDPRHHGGGRRRRHAMLVTLCNPPVNVLHPIIIQGLKEKYAEAWIATKSRQSCSPILEANFVEALISMCSQKLTRLVNGPVIDSWPLSPDTCPSRRLCPSTPPRPPPTPSVSASSAAI